MMPTPETVGTHRKHYFDALLILQTTYNENSPLDKMFIASISSSQKVKLPKSWLLAVTS